MNRRQFLLGATAVLSVGDIASAQSSRAYPQAYRYSREHVWVSVRASVATMGITDFAQEALGDIVFVELPPVGTRVEAGKALCSVESVITVSDVMSPIAGVIVFRNDSLNENPERINEDPNGVGWLIRMKMRTRLRPEGLMTASQYRAYVEG